MALDLHTLRNVGEFYSQHYLDEVLEGDLKELWKRWRQQAQAGGTKAPSEALLALKKPYFDALARCRGMDSQRETPEQLRLRQSLAQDFHARLLACLGYVRYPKQVLLGEARREETLPLLAEIEVQGKPYLWVVQAPFARSDDQSDPLRELPIGLSESHECDASVESMAEEYSETEEEGELKLGLGLGLGLPLRQAWRDLLDGPLFRQEHPPRWVLLLAAGDLFLIDRYKWPQGQYLHFEMGKMLGSDDKPALQVLAGMLHREVLAPDDGQSILDHIDDNSHKHAFAVSTDLKFGVQQAIELIGNEAVYFKRNVAKDGVFKHEDLAEALTRDCINYLYRLVFLFFAEARAEELDMLPMKSDIYRMGYSLESLRDLELVELTTQDSQDGYFLHESLQKLFSIVQGGYGLGQRQLVAIEEGRGAEHLNSRYDFWVPALRSQLFDPEKTPILGAVKLRNHVLQKVLELLSLSREGGSHAARGRGKGGSKRQQRGRISYGKLGINQLGAVYEGLLSYSGFFAQEKLYEVRAPKEIADESARTFFVPQSQIDRYEENCLVKDQHGRPKTYKKGSYLFRLSGRARETLASYYTPEVLTRCLTRLTLKERIGEPPSLSKSPSKSPSKSSSKSSSKSPLDQPKVLRADEILELSICEPAMGSGAFLNEAVNQLADAYLERKQEETGETIAAESYQAEKQKVKYHFVAHRCFGVDLNPLAVELGKISLWLNVLQPEVQTPYLDLHVRVGNSLIGARREVYLEEDLRGAKGKNGDRSMVPTRVPWGDKRPKNSVYHFLLFDSGMLPFDQDKVIRSLCPNEVAAIKAWKIEMVQPYSKEELQRLVALSDAIDRLWAAHIEMQSEVAQKLRQPIALWGQPELSSKDRPRWKSVHEGEELGLWVWQGRGHRVSDGLRLKAIMDFWCALWRWPISQAKSLPSRADWLQRVQGWIEAPSPETMAKVRAEKRFLHWDLEFAGHFAKHGGFDVVLGNPPWIKVEWKESHVLGDSDPQIVLKKWSATTIATRRQETLARQANLASYLAAFEEDASISGFLGRASNMPLLKGVKSNLYKCFLLQAWKIQRAQGERDKGGREQGVVGILCQPGIFDDSNGGPLRGELSGRIRHWAQFKNELLLFSNIDNHCAYAILVTGSVHERNSFLLCSNLLHPKTIEASMDHDGLGPIPGIKNEAGDWDLRPHRSRLIEVDEASLALFATLYDPPGTPARQARLPVVHSREILEVLRCFAKAPRKLGDLKDQYFCTQHFNETNQQKDNTIKAKVCVPKTVDDWVVSGPHFYVGTPFYKTPNEGCRHNKDYSLLDLTQIPDDYLPRTNYVRACTPVEYRKRTPHWKGRPVTEFYRHVHRRRISPTGERTLISAIFPPGCASIHTTVSTLMEDESDLLVMAAQTASLPIDFFVKSTGKTDFYGEDLVSMLPVVPPGPSRDRMIARILRLCCLTTPYSEIWRRHYKVVAGDKFTTLDSRMEKWKDVGPDWQSEFGLRTPLSRRQALVELDVLAALALGLSLDQLQLIYRVQFPVLHQYERETFYDQRGKIVFTINKGLTRVGVDRSLWTQIQAATSGESLPPEARDAQGPFVPPFDRCDREHDMAQAYAYFAARLNKGGSKRKTSSEEHAA